MNSRPPALQALVALLTLTVLCGATRGAQGPGTLDFEALGLGGLTPLERARVQQAAGSLACPCSGGQMLGDCPSAGHVCPRSRRLLRACGALPGMGASRAAILGELADYERSRLQPAALTLERAGCKGAAHAPVTVVAFSDFECPACANLPALTDALLVQAEGKARFCFKPFPLASPPHSFEASQAAEFALAQGRFWQLHDRLFTHQSELDREGLRRQARAAGLDDEALARALDAGSYRAAVEASVREGTEANVAATPSLFVNGRRLTLPPLTEFLNLAIEDALEASQQD